MNQMEEIITVYATADEELRLSMFLSHRDYRLRFTEIDMAEMKAQKNAASKRVKGLARNPRLHGLTRQCWGWLKHCRSAR